MRAGRARTRAPGQSSSSEVRSVIPSPSQSQATQQQQWSDLVPTSNHTDFHNDGCLTVSEVKILLEQREQAADNQCVGPYLGYRV